MKLNSQVLVPQNGSNNDLQLKVKANRVGSCPKGYKKSKVYCEG
jgi:hypothetical protein